MAQYGIQKVGSDPAYEVYMLTDLESGKKPFRALVPKNSPEAAFLEQAQRQAGDRELRTAELQIETKEVAGVSPTEVSLSLEQSGKATYIKEARPVHVFNRGLQRRVEGSQVIIPFTEELDRLTRRKMRLDIYNAMLQDLERFTKDPELQACLRSQQQARAIEGVKEDLKRIEAEKNRLRQEVTEALLPHENGLPLEIQKVASNELMANGIGYAHKCIEGLIEGLNSGKETAALSKQLTGLGMTAGKAGVWLQNFQALSPKDREWLRDYLKPRGDSEDKQRAEEFLEACKSIHGKAEIREIANDPDAGEILIGTIELRSEDSANVEAIQREMSKEMWLLNEPGKKPEWPPGSLVGPDKRKYQWTGKELVEEGTGKAIGKFPESGMFEGPDNQKYYATKGGFLAVAPDGHLYGRNGPFSAGLQKRIGEVTKEGKKKKLETEQDRSRKVMSRELSVLNYSPTLRQSLNHLDAEEIDKIPLKAGRLIEENRRAKALEGVLQGLETGEVLPPNTLEDTFSHEGRIFLDGASALQSTEIIGELGKDRENDLARVSSFYYGRAIIEELATANVMAAHQGHVTDVNGEYFWDRWRVEVPRLSMANPYLYSNPSSHKPVPTPEASRLMDGMAISCATELFTQLGKAQSRGKMEVEGGRVNETFRGAIEGHLLGKPRNFEQILRATGKTVKQTTRSLSNQIETENRRTLGRVEASHHEKLDEYTERGVVYSALVLGLTAHVLGHLDPER